MTSTEMAVFSDLAPCSLVETFRAAYCLHHQVDKGYHHSDGGGS
jgi:hypothetical protein